jgi:CMP-N,N'-diacetyllegionaminic acid synthase
MKILAIIPARGGSKRIPMKNIRLLGEKPLINWTIDLAKQVPELCDILVSTDDQAIYEISVTAGALVPWLRPVELATDYSSSVDVVLHALNWYESTKSRVQAVLLLQPTSPFRSLESIREGIRLFHEKGGLPVVGVSKVHQHPEWMLSETNGYISPWMNAHGLGVRSQDLLNLYIPNGSFYLVSVEDLRNTNSFYQNLNLPLVSRSMLEGMDLDTEEDFRFAESLVQNLNLK